MTEAQWWSERVPVRAITALRFQFHAARTRQGRRKLRLYGVACCRRALKLLPAQAVAVIEAAESLADGHAAADEFLAAFDRLESNPGHGAQDHQVQAFLNARRAFGQLGGNAGDAAQACSAIVIALRWLDAQSEAAEIGIQMGLLHDVFANPFQPAITERALLTWRDATIPKLAQAAYDERELPTARRTRRPTGPPAPATLSSCDRTATPSISSASWTTRCGGGGRAWPSVSHCSSRPNSHVRLTGRGVRAHIPSLT